MMFNCGPIRKIINILTMFWKIYLEGGHHTTSNKKIYVLPRTPSSLSRVMCSQDFLRSIRFLESLFFPECLGTSSEQYRNRDRHQLLARENVPRFSGKFCSKLTLVIEFEAHKRVPWLSERRQVTRNLQSGLISIDKSIYFLHRNNIPSLLPLYFIQNSRCR